MGRNEELYRNRPLSLGYPGLEELGVRYFTEHQETATRARTEELLDCLGRLIDLTQGPRTVAVVGCGPRPRAVRELVERGFAVVAVEPVPGHVLSATEELGDLAEVLQASAEQLPLPTASQRLVLLDSVLEHVDSPARSLAEAHRVLRPGGVLFVRTTNRLRLHIRPEVAEFRPRFFHLYPRLVQESFVFQHLHHDPTLANYTTRPAVHWFTYDELCAAGRQAGFAQFYSLLDLVDSRSPSVQRGRLRPWLLEAVRRRPWLRALALTQVGGTVFMLRREE